MIAVLVLSMLATTAQQAGAARGDPTTAAPSEIAKRLSLLTDTMDIALVRDGARRSGGRYIVSLSRATVAGRPALIAAAHDQSPQGQTTYDTLAVDATTLAPLWHRVHAPGDSAAVEYRGRTASGYAAHENQPRSAVSATLSDQAIEGALVDWYLAAVRWRPADSVTVAAFCIWGNAEDTATYRVVGSETLPLRNGTAETWVVQETHGPGDRVLRKRWIDKRTRRTLQTFDAPPRAAHPDDGYWKRSSLLRQPGV